MDSLKNEEFRNSKREKRREITKCFSRDVKNIEELQHIEN